MKTGTMVPYAVKRIKQHVGRFNKLYDDIHNAMIDEEWLKELEWRDNIFKDMDCAYYYLSPRPSVKSNKGSVLLSASQSHVKTRHSDFFSE